MSAANLEALTQIWQRVLRRPSIGADESFFALGGSQAQVIELFNEIKRTIGRDLPPLIIFEAPTIRSLANIFETGQVPTLAPVVTLRSGTHALPIFMAHGISQSLLDFIGLAESMDTDCQINGIQSPGIDGITAPLDCMDDLVEFHMKAIRSVQPHGPYFLVGYSFGGLVLLEVARRLRASGQKIALLAMLDSYPHPSYLPLREKIQTAVLSLRSRLRSAPPNLGPKPSGLFLKAIKNVGEASRQAWDEYRPSYYPGEVKFIRAERISLFPSSAQAVWGKLTKKLEVITVPGDHTGMISIRYKELADALSKLVHEGTQA